MYFTVLTLLRIKRTRKTYPGDVVQKGGSKVDSWLAVCNDMKYLIYLASRCSP
jgi:hypothetical protein